MLVYNAKWSRKKNNLLIRNYKHIQNMDQTVEVPHRLWVTNTLQADSVCFGFCGWTVDVCLSVCAHLCVCSHLLPAAAAWTEAPQRDLTAKGFPVTCRPQSVASLRLRRTRPLGNMHSRMHARTYGTLAYAFCWLCACLCSTSSSSTEPPKPIRSLFSCRVGWWSLCSTRSWMASTIYTPTGSCTETWWERESVG